MWEWDDDFHELLLELVAPEHHDAITSTVEFADIGLDSMASVQLVVALENRYEIIFPPEFLDAERFASPGVLWNSVRMLRSAAA